MTLLVDPVTGATAGSPANTMVGMLPYIGNQLYNAGRVIATQAPATSLAVQGAVQNTVQNTKPHHILLILAVVLFIWWLSQGNGR